MRLVPAFLLSGLAFSVFFSCAGSSNDKPLVTVEKSRNITQVSVLQDSSGEDLNEEFYKDYKRLRIEGPIIPGLQDALVPQGIAYMEKADLMIISNYMNDESAGILTVLDMTSGSFVKALYLYNHNNEAHKGHLGGLAVGNDYLWIASGPGVYPLALNRIMEASHGDIITLPRIIETETKASFATFYNNTLWIGEFTRQDGSYAVSKTHHRTTRTGTTQRAWLGAYTLDKLSERMNTDRPKEDKLIPDYILSITDEIQGAVFFDDKILLSASFGRRNNSRLYLYQSPFAEADHQKTESLYFLDGQNLIQTMIAPPMSEGLVLYMDHIALLFESAASKYRKTALSPLDRIQYLPVNAFTTVEQQE